MMKTQETFRALKQKKTSPLIRLWILRILVLLGVHKKYLDSYDSIDSEIAIAIGLVNANDATIRPRRRRWHKTIEKEEEEETKRCLNRLYELHKKAENGKARYVSPVLTKNLKALQVRLQLSETEYQILAFAILLSTEKALYTVADEVEITSSKKLSAVLSVILGLHQEDIRRALAPTSILHKSGLLELNQGRHNDLADILELISDDFADSMVSSADSAMLLSSMVLPGKAPQLHLSDYPHIEEELSILIPYLKASSASRKSGVNIFIHGMPGTGKTELARILAKHLKLQLYEVVSEDEDGELLSGKKRLRAFSAAQAFFSQDKALMLFDEAEDAFNNPSSFFRFFVSQSTSQSNKAGINRILEENPVPAIWLSNSVSCLDPAFLRRFDMVFELPLAPKNQREKIIRKISHKLLDARTVSQLAESEKLSPAIISRATSVVRMIGSDLKQATPGKAVTFLVNNTLESQGNAPIRLNGPNRLPEIYDASFVNADANLSEIAQGIALSKSARLCLYGPPGTGKTAFGRWLAEEIGVPLHIKRASDLLSMWVGESEKNIARAFRRAERANAMLLIDEADSFLHDRRGANHSWEVSQVNEMLTQMESFSGIFIASTNLINSLDQASLRRFDLKIKFDFLKAEQAWRLFERYCHHRGWSLPDEKWQNRLCRLHNLTPGDFAAVARQTRFRTIASGEELLVALEKEVALKENSQQTIGFV